MVAIFPPQTVLTAGDAANQLQSNGLDALGLTLPNLSSGWANATPAAGDYAAAALTLVLNGVRAPFRSIRTFETNPTVWSDVTGAPLPGPLAVLRLHPEALHRLETLVAARYGAPVIRPVPVAMVIRGIPAPPPGPQVVEWHLAGEPLPLAGNVTVSFHDARGLPIDPLAVASLFLDLINAQPGLRLGHATMPAAGAAGGLNGIVALATAGVRCHVIDPHGWGYVSTRPEARLKVLDAANAEVSPVADGGLVDLAANQTLGRSAADDASVAQPPLRWGWTVNGTLARAALAPPALPAGAVLATQFFRVMAVDLDWHLLGNRTAASIAGIPGDDDAVPDFALPVVRAAVPVFDYLIDGLDVLGAAAQIAAGFPPGGGAGAFALAVSPALDMDLAVPPATGAAGHWPDFPDPDLGTTLQPNSDATRNLTAAFRAPADGPNANLDVILTIAADVVPPGTHIRAFPRRFVEIQAIGEQPSFVRDDGGSGIAAAGATTPILLINPFELKPGDPLPSPAVLEVDLVITDRQSRRRLHSLARVDVSAVPQPATGTLAPFGGVALLNQPGLNTLLTLFGMTSIAPTPLFGLVRPPAPAGSPSGILDLVRRLASEETPRQGPRLPTQARFETILALGTSATPASQLTWRAVLSGARWTWESRCAQPELGDPGNPAGPDLHAAGIRCDGVLAYDLAFHALKRAQPIIPLSSTTPGWLIAGAGDNWNEPPADTTGTVAAVMLETVAAFCDTPELAVDAIPIPQPGDTIQSALDALAGALGVSSPTFTSAAEDKLRKRLQREMVTAKRGQRDAFWSLTRALGQAREFVYIESPAFARTARPGDPPKAHEIDLVEVLRRRLQDNPRLKIALCVPRLPDFTPAKANWVRAALQHRKAAIETLTTQDRNRVAAFHPIGFPGRPTAIRSTVVIVDDVFCLVGTSHFRRRGMTFDGGVDIASIDRSIAKSYSAGIARFRQELMANKIGVPIATSTANTTALWTRLAQPESAFDVLADLLAQGGLGRISPVWAGPPASDTSVIPQSDAVADPDGVDEDGRNLLAVLGALVIEN